MKENNNTQTNNNKLIKAALFLKKRIRASYQRERPLTGSMFDKFSDKFFIFLFNKIINHT
jgi:hypothetical protein